MSWLIVVALWVFGAALASQLQDYSNDIAPEWYRRITVILWPVFILIGLCGTLVDWILKKVRSK